MKELSAASKPVQPGTSAYHFLIAKSGPQRTSELQQNHQHDLQQDGRKNVYKSRRGAETPKHHPGAAESALPHRPAP